MQLWQELAENFYPERADFTMSNRDGDEFASHLTSAAPVLARRDLANQIQAMLRPRGKEWFGLAYDDEDGDEDAGVSEFTKKLAMVQRKFMAEPQAQFQRATKQGDNDFITFGQGVLTVEAVVETTSLLYRAWHLRDVVWTENNRGELDRIHRNWNPTARQLAMEYGENKLHQKVRECLSPGKDPDQIIKCRHVFIPFDEYDYTPEKKLNRNPDKIKFMRLCVDVDNQHVMTESPVEDHPYIIPRWQLVSGSQYAHSPAAHYGLADARTLQAISFTLLKAGEKAVDPPMVATQEAVRSDIDIRPGGITWADAEYDERLGEVLRPMSQDSSGLRFGTEMMDRHLAMIHEAFFLNKINLPPMSGDMTAYEVQVRTQEYIRNALPLFEPLETEYNAPICEKTFNILLKMGAFGRPDDSWPEELRGAELKWNFESPLADTSRKEESQRFMETANLLSIAAQIDPALKGDWDYRKHFRESLKGLRAPMVDEDEANEAREAEEGMAQMMQAAQMAGAGGEAAEQVGKGGAALAGMMPGQGEAA